MLIASAGELAAGRLEPGTVAAVQDELLRSGYAVLGDVIPHSVLDTLAPLLDLQAAQHVALRAAEGEAHTPRGWSLPGGFPRSAPHADPLLVVNPLIEHVVASMLGEGAFLSFCNGNCNATRPVQGEPEAPWDAGGLHHGLSQPH